MGRLFPFGYDVPLYASSVKDIGSLAIATFDEYASRFGYPQTLAGSSLSAANPHFSYG
jgi:hypothetical protein